LAVISTAGMTAPTSNLGAEASPNDGGFSSFAATLMGAALAIACTLSRGEEGGYGVVVRREQTDAELERREAVVVGNEKEIGIDAEVGTEVCEGDGWGVKGGREVRPLLPSITAESRVGEGDEDPTQRW